MLNPRGDRIPGYRVVRRLATGGTSDVLLAECDGTAHGADGEQVVLKVLLATYRQDPTFERMFAREAAAYGRLKDPCIVALHDIFSSSQQMVMVLEYVDGLSLHRMRNALPDGFDDAACVEIARGIFGGLAAAHGAHDESGASAPVVHRDVNPSNVLLSWKGDVKLADFGIAKVTGVAGDTKTGFIKGTFGYMSPEQVRGESISEKTDIYAAMLILWELFSRRKAHDPALSELELMRAMAHPRLPSLDSVRADLPRAIRALIARGLQPTPERRDVTATEALRVLDENYDRAKGRASLNDELHRARLEFERRASLRPPPLEEAPRDSLPSVSEEFVTAIPRAPRLPGPVPPPAPVTLPILSKERSTMPTPRSEDGAGEARPSAPRPIAPKLIAPVAAPANAVVFEGPEIVAPPPAATVPDLLGPTLEPPVGETAPPIAPPFAPPPVIFPMSGAPPGPAPQATSVEYVSLPPQANQAVPFPQQPMSYQGAEAPFGGAVPYVNSANLPTLPPARPRGPGKGALVVLGLVGAGTCLVLFLAVRVARGVLDGNGQDTGRSATRPALTAPPTEHPESTATIPPPPSTVPEATAVPKVEESNEPSAVTSLLTPPPVKSAKPATQVKGPLTKATGILSLPPRARGHRVYLDGHLVGESPKSLDVACGKHEVRIGSHGKDEPVSVPCGGELKMK